MSYLKKAIEPKSDQLNADDLIAAPMTITITDVRQGNKEQPVNIHYEGGDGKPYKPCKSMTRLLVKLWGDESKNWIGQQLTIFCDDSVMFGGQKVGGIRISHMTNIDKDTEVLLTASRGKRKPYKVKKLKAIDVAPLLEAGEKAAEGGLSAFKEWGATLSPEEKQAIRSQVKYLMEIAKENGE